MSQEDPRLNPYARPGSAEAPVQGGAEYAPGAHPELYTYMPAFEAQQQPEDLSAEPGIYHTYDTVDMAPDEDLPADYEVQSEERLPEQKKSHALLVLLVLVICAGILVALLYGLPKLGQQAEAPSAPPQAATTEAPITVRAYTAAQKQEASPEARALISRLVGTMPVETAFTTDGSIVCRSPVGSGLYDFYLFDAAGNLNCYFDTLADGECFAGEDGTIYVRQSPYLLNNDGEPLFSLRRLQGVNGEEAVLQPLRNGLGIIERGGEYNYIAKSGDLLSDVWYSSACPFSGSYTTAWTDSGNIGSDQRYLLFMISKTEGAVRWFAAADTQSVIGTLCSLCVFRDGSVYALPHISNPALTVSEVCAYPDFSAAVLRNAETGLYGLWINGDCTYPCEYDAIEPVESDLHMTSVVSTLAGPAVRVTAIDSAQTLPVSYTFRLSRNGTDEYAALSVTGTPCDVTNEYAWLNR